MSPLETVQFILWWTSGCVLFAAVAVTPFIIVRSSLRLLQKDAVLRHFASALHNLGYKEEYNDNAVVPTFFIEPRWGFSWARALFVFVVTWRSYALQNKTLLMLIVDGIAEYMSRLGYNVHPHESGLTVLSIKRTYSGAVARWINEYVLPFRWWLEDRNNKKRVK